MQTPCQNNRDTPPNLKINRSPVCLNKRSTKLNLSHFCQSFFFVQRLRQPLRIVNGERLGIKWIFPWTATAFTFSLREPPLRSLSHSVNATAFTFSTVNCHCVHLLISVNRHCVFTPIFVNHLFMVHSPQNHLVSFSSCTWTALQQVAYRIQLRLSLTIQIWPVKVPDHRWSVFRMLSTVVSSHQLFSRRFFLNVIWLQEAEDFFSKCEWTDQHFREHP